MSHLLNPNIGDRQKKSLKERQQKGQKGDKKGTGVKKREKGRKVYKEMKREKKGRTIKKLVTYVMLLLCCFYVAFVCHSLCSEAGKRN